MYQTFPKIKYSKSKYRTNLDDEHLLATFLVGTTEFDTNYHGILKDKRFRTSRWVAVTSIAIHLSSLLLPLCHSLKKKTIQLSAEVFWNNLTILYYRVVENYDLPDVIAWPFATCLTRGTGGGFTRDRQPTLITEIILSVSIHINYKSIINNSFLNDNLTNVVVFFFIYLFTASSKVTRAKKQKQKKKKRITKYSSIRIAEYNSRTPSVVCTDRKPLVLYNCICVFFFLLLLLLGQTSCCMRHYIPQMRKPDVLFVYIYYCVLPADRTERPPVWLLACCLLRFTDIDWLINYYYYY